MAAFVMAPPGLIFDKTGLASINHPVFLYYGQDDEVLRPKYTECMAFHVVMKHDPPGTHPNRPKTPQCAGTPSQDSARMC